MKDLFFLDSVLILKTDTPAATLVFSVSTHHVHEIFQWMGWDLFSFKKKKKKIDIKSLLLLFFLLFFSLSLFLKYPGWKVILRRLVVITVFIYLLYKVDRQTNFPFFSSFFSFSFFKQRKCFSIVEFSTHRTDIPHTAEWRATTEARGTHRLIKFYIWTTARTQRTLPGEHVGSHCPMLRMTTLSSVRHDGTFSLLLQCGRQHATYSQRRNVCTTTALTLPHWSKTRYICIDIHLFSLFFWGVGVGVKI